MGIFWSLLQLGVQGPWVASDLHGCEGGLQDMGLSMLDPGSGSGSSLLTQGLQAGTCVQAQTRAKSQSLELSGE